MRPGGQGGGQYQVYKKGETGTTIQEKGCGLFSGQSCNPMQVQFHPLSTNQLLVRFCT